jgi:hypothetical protein
MIKGEVMWIFFHNKIQHFRDKKVYRAWLHAGKPIPPPDIMKQLPFRKLGNLYFVRLSGPPILLFTSTPETLI